MFGKGNFNLLIVFAYAWAYCSFCVYVCVFVWMISIASFKSHKQIHWIYFCCCCQICKLANSVLRIGQRTYASLAELWSCSLAEICCCSPEIFSNQLSVCVNFLAPGQVLFLRPHSLALSLSLSAGEPYLMRFILSPRLGVPFCLLCAKQQLESQAFLLLFRHGHICIFLCLKRIAFPNTNQ